MASHLIKKSTGITGLKVQPNGRQILSDLLHKTLTKLQLIPKEAGFRDLMESQTQFRLDVLKRETDVVIIENTIGCGQLEELIEDTKLDFKVIDDVIKYKAWELKDKNQPPLIIFSK
ncbi:hypothetical protein CYY_000187 [Polysphondylium violaceum]|uniref:Uncharacterized protein n=1 Tax=Polysphondylium violaceum TaxID=133409 RepID=A0A8J4Q5A4_9MYCE|nr:hypothetical protein CYY_000187 [Polysphondylium violaceum]